MVLRNRLLRARVAGSSDRNENGMSRSVPEEEARGSEIEALTPDLLDDTNNLIVASLAEGATHAEAGRIAGVSAKTVQRRMRNPAFTRMVAERRRERRHCCIVLHCSIAGRDGGIQWSSVFQMVLMSSSKAADTRKCWCRVSLPSS